jgi:nicotinamidase-related amidase
VTTNTALLVIDVQVGVVETAYQLDEVLSNINVLLSRARSSETPVIYVQHNETGWLEPGGKLWQIHPAITPQEGEPAIQKEAPDSFYETRLQEELEAHGIKRLVICGAATQYCVDTTVRRAVSLGYDVLLAGDAHTTDGSKILSSQDIIAFANETLNGFGAGKHTVRVQPTSEILFAPA